MTQSSWIEREKRFGVRWFMRVGHREAGSLLCRTLDVSVSGMLFESPAPYNLGELVEAEIWLDAGTIARLVVEIVRQVGKHPGGYTYGARFCTDHSAHDDVMLVRDRLLAILRQSQDNAAAVHADPAAMSLARAV